MPDKNETSYRVHETWSGMLYKPGDPGYKKQQERFRKLGMTEYIDEDKTPKGVVAESREADSISAAVQDAETD